MIVEAIESKGATPLRQLMHSLSGLSQRRFAEICGCSINCAEAHWLAYRVFGNSGGAHLAHENHWKYYVTRKDE